MNSRGGVFVIVLPALLALWSACGSPPSSEHPASMFRGGPDHSGVYQTLGVDKLGGELWRFETGGPVRSSPAIAGDAVFFGSTDGKLYAVNRNDGEELWQVDVQSAVSSSPAVVQGLVVFGARDGTFHAVDSHTGRQRWQFETGNLLPWEWGFEGWDVYTSSPVISDTTVVIGAGDGVVYALGALAGNELWRFPTQGRIRATPAIANGVVYAGSTDGRAYALDLATGRERWRFATQGAGMVSADNGVDRKSIIASPAVDDGIVYIGSRDGYMYALDEETGAEKWRFGHDGSWAMSSPAVSGGMVYAGTSDGRWVHAVDAETAEEHWRFVGEGYTWSSPAIAGNTVFIGDGSGYLRAIARESGAERWNFRVGDGVYSSPAVHDGVVFFGADDGNVYALHGDGTRPHLAVYWDEAYVDYALFRSHVETRVHFTERGYEELNTNALLGFLDARIEDRAPSAIVFAMDPIPLSINTEPSDSVALMRYLLAGGKVVWPQLPPMVLVRNDSGRITAIDRNRPSTMLGVDYSDFNFDFYASTPTELGRSWGMSRGWVSSYSVPMSDSIRVLALDETGRAGAWVKNFGGPQGTGFVGVGLDHASANALAALRAVAEYGLVGKRPATPVIH